VIDELAEESRRTSLLDRLEEQLKGQPHVSRLLFAFSVSDDKKQQQVVEKEFAKWRKDQEDGENLTGILIFLGQAAVHLVEGPSELLFRSLDFFNSLGPEASHANTPGGGAGKAHAARPSVGALRVLYFTELHGLRASRGWFSCPSSMRMQGSQQQSLDEGNCPEMVFMLHKKILALCRRATELAGGEVQVDHYKRLSEWMPSAEEVMIFLGKAGVELLMTFPEFKQVFIAPFRLTLHSELLWPMPPALSY